MRPVLRTMTQGNCHCGDDCDTDCWWNGTISVPALSLLQKYMLNSVPTQLAQSNFDTSSFKYINVLM